MFLYLTFLLRCFILKLSIHSGGDCSDSNQFYGFADQQRDHRISHSQPNVPVFGQLQSCFFAERAVSLSFRGKPVAVGRLHFLPHSRFHRLHSAGTSVRPLSGRSAEADLFCRYHVYNFCSFFLLPRKILALIPGA